MAQNAVQSKFKAGLVYRESQSRWISCLKINAGLGQAYEAISGLEIVRFELYSSRKSSLEVARDIIKSGVGILVFVDHQVRPAEILRYQEIQSYISQKKVRIIFHLYGCYMDRLTEFNIISEFLKGQDVHFVTASFRHKSLVESTLKGVAQKVHLVPFPLEMEFLDSDARSRSRKKLGISESESLLIYVGRISPCKNVEFVMELLSRIRLKRKDIKFIYIGAFDNYDAMSTNDTCSNSAIINAKLLAQIDPFREWCFYHPYQVEKELNDYFAAADGFISLSTCRGEDFGMSVLEACYAGIPCFLTDWGGYEGFSKLPTNNYAKVTISENDICIEVEALEREMLELRKTDEAERFFKFNETSKHFSILASSEKLNSILSDCKSSFQGIKNTPLIIRQLETMQGNAFRMVVRMKELYGPYWK